MLDMAAAHQHDSIASLIGMIVVEQQPLEIRVALFQYFQQLQNVARAGRLMHPCPTIIRYVAKNLTFIQPLTGKASGIWRQWGRLPPSSRKLMMIPTFAVDVMCIKPFDEGTGRLARLFSLLLMEKAGFDVGRYVSVDRLCERHAAAYYEALNACT